MSDKDKRSAFTTVVISDIENNTQEVMYNSYTLPLLFYNGTDMSKNIEKIEAVPDKGITIQNDIVFYDKTYEDANSTFEFVMITLNELEGTQTHSLAELIDDGFTITPFINGGGGGSSDFSTAKMTVINNKTVTTVGDIQCDNCPTVLAEYEELKGGFYVEANSQSIIDVVLYKGHAHIYEIKTGSAFVEDVNLETEVSLSGNAVYNDGIDITGDCTISIS